MEEQNKELEQVPQKETGIAALDWMRKKYQHFRGLTKKNESDNIWILGVKVFFQAIMILILIALSPIALFVITLSLLVAG